MCASIRAQGYRTASVTRLAIRASPVGRFTAVYRAFGPPNATAAHLSASPRLPRAQRTQSAAHEALERQARRTGRGQVQRLVGRLDCQHAASRYVDYLITIVMTVSL
jgi:hypothetical protein